MRAEIVKELALTFEVCGGDLSLGAKQLIVHELNNYSEDEIKHALRRCRREVKGRLSLADIIARFPRRHPTADEAWSLIPKSEDESVVWTKEMASAHRAVQGLLVAGDIVGARLAFRDSYNRAVEAAGGPEREPAWSFSPGHDPGLREGALRDAVCAGRLGEDDAKRLLPGFGTKEAKMLPEARDESSDKFDWKAWIKFCRERFGKQCIEGKKDKANETND